MIRIECPADEKSSKGIVTGWPADVPPPCRSSHRLFRRFLDKATAAIGRTLIGPATTPMDAGAMEFKDDSFDTVARLRVPLPRLPQGCQRNDPRLPTGGRIIMLTLHQRNKIIAAMEKVISLSRDLGWRQTCSPYLLEGTPLPLPEAEWNTDGPGHWWNVGTGST